MNSYIANSEKHIRQYINELVQDGLGIMNASDEELQLLLEAPQRSVYYFADMISRRAQVGWSTHGHSAVDVNIYSTGAKSLHGNHENTEIGDFLQSYLDVDVQPITEELVEKLKGFSIAGEHQTAWTGKIPSEADFESVSRHYESLYSDAPPPLSG